MKTYDIRAPLENEASVPALEAELKELRESISKQDESTQAYLEQIKRLQADFENWRKRVEAEKLLLVEMASSVLAEKLLPVLDNFERALLAGESQAADAAFKNGMDLIDKQLFQILKQEGLEEIESVGRPFDPVVHEAYTFEERDDCADHVVLEEARKGYRFKGKVLRPALVKVSKTTKRKKKDHIMNQEVEK